MSNVHIIFLSLSGVKKNRKSSTSLKAIFSLIRSMSIKFRTWICSYPKWYAKKVLKKRSAGNKILDKMSPKKGSLLKEWPKNLSRKVEQFFCFYWLIRPDDPKHTKKWACGDHFLRDNYSGDIFSRDFISRDFIFQGFVFPEVFYPRTFFHQGTFFAQNTPTIISLSTQNVKSFNINTYM